MRAGVDTGGTFTDVVLADGSIRKVPSTPRDPSAAVAGGLDGVAVSVLAHGTTVATNALLEGNLAPVSLVTNEGLEDVIEIARQNRPSLYDQFADRPPPLVPRDQRFGVAGRLAADGSELTALGEVPDVDRARAVAICLLHADLDPSHERAVAAALRASGCDVTASHEISPEMREYERTVTTVVNAALRPVSRDYLAGLGGLAPEVLVMTSAGGLIDLHRAAEHPARLLLSGPAAGVRAAAQVAAANGFDRAVSFDMGGTSTDVCLIDGGLPEPAPSLVVGGYPVRLPALAIHTVGAGGGSIAGVDDGGAVTVGPRSAGAIPGPACYGHGGDQATVTDADLLLGRIPADAELPGIGRLDPRAASSAMERAGVTATDVVAVVDAAMTEAVRVVSVAQGVDPRDCALVAFGGAGPLHACAIAEALGMAAVVVPARAGVFSAVGLVGAPIQLDLVRSIAPGDDPAAAAVELSASAAQLLPGAACTTSYDCRYAGQSHELRVASIDAFHGAHQQRNGYRLDGALVEVVAVRVRGELASPIDPATFADAARSPVTGPAIVAEEDTTVWVPPGWHGEPGAHGALVLRRQAAGSGTREAGPERLGGVAANGLTTADSIGPVAAEAGGPATTTASGPATANAGGPATTKASGPVAVEAGGGGHGGGGGGRVKPQGARGAATDIGGAELAVLIARLTGIADEMGLVLRRAAFSPNIKERADCSAALFTATGELLVQAEHIPVHLGAMPASVAAAIAHVGADAGPSDHIVVNDPYAGGTHLNDITVVTPVFVSTRLVGWVANRAHHADVGGAAPGSMPADATEIAQEGFRIPPLRLTPEVRSLLLANSRTPAERAGDLDAQVGANVVGARRMAALVEAGAPVHEVIAYGERRMRAAISAVPHGSWMFTDQIDAGYPGGTPVAVTVTLTADGESLTFDFAGCGPQQPGNVNAVEAVTVSSAVFAARSVLGPTIPANAGSLRPIRVVVEPGTIVAAEPPAAVAAGNVEVSQRVADVCLGALAQALPGRVGAAGQGTMNNLLLGGRGWVYYETVAGGQGARPGRDGMSGVHTAMTNTMNTPIEALERAFPVRVRRLRLRPGSGGAGRWRGGDGVERDVEVLEPVVMSLITERRSSSPWGLEGGGPGARGENWILPGGDEAAAEPLPDKCTRPLAAGDVVRVRTPGGGGWGAPA